MTEHTEAIDNRRHDDSGLERHFGTIMTALILAAILWIGNTSLELVKTQTLMAGDIKLMNSQMSYLKETIAIASTDRYTKSDAKVDKNTFGIRISNIEARMSRIENDHHNFKKNSKGTD